MQGGMIAAIIVFSVIVLGLSASVYNDSKNPEAARVSPRNNTFIKDDSINNPDSDTDSDTSISEGDSLLGKGYRDRSDSADDPNSINYGNKNPEGGSRRKHRKSNKGSKGRKASKGSKERKSRKHNNKKSKSKNSKSF